MSLSGNLGFVSLDEVLRLLTRSDQQGSVDVTGDGVRGRIFVTRGGVVLATTWDDTGMHRHLVKSGLVDDAYLAEVENGTATLAPIVEKSGGALTELLREMTVESLYQLGLKGDGFEVREGEGTNYANPSPFDLESLLQDSKARLTDWAEVSKSVSNLDGVMRFIRDLGARDDVNIDSESWKVLSEIGSGSSVATIAEELGTTDFWTARVAARLIDQDLIAFDTDETPQETPQEESWAVATEEGAEEEEAKSTDSWWEEPAEEASDEETAEASEMPTAEVPVTEVTHEAFEEDEADEQPEAAEEEQKSIFGAYKPVAPDQAEEDQSEIPALSDEGDAEDVEEDTEAFLEKVFSELESPDDETEGEGHGLLRRRRLGAIRDSDV